MGRRPTRVLVVDDEPELRELLSDALRQEDVEVISAGSGAEAIDAARRQRPDLLIADVRLGDANGLELIDRLREEGTDVPAFVVTGLRDPELLSDATRRRPVEVLLKPFDVEHLRSAVRAELDRLELDERVRRRQTRLRRLAHGLNRQRRRAQRELETTCADLTSAYRTLSGQLGVQQTVIQYQTELVSAASDDDVFRALFRAFVQRSGGLFGVAMVCNDEAELQIVGRFGVPQPDSPSFCQALVKPMVGAVLSDPHCDLMDAGDHADLFDASIRRYLPGVSVLTVPLLPSDGELIGLVVLYRKGEQPFTDGDVAFAELIAPPTALAIKRNG